ncbi:hypothetical protein [Streptomyces flavofungini]|uniref:hypothetical protein n=1 Tax=Streptomyces flavofungini TaxID=68200 RepID=UPI0025B11711|nr:hypothetical protein [Streptomyces flavofungini]WJV51690.1 hypothetical protein QUY26_40230 [Streptomyces flavofungini]
MSVVDSVSAATEPVLREQDHNGSSARAAIPVTAISGIVTSGIITPVCFAATPHVGGITVTANG